MLDPYLRGRFVDTAGGPMYSRGRASTLRKRYPDHSSHHKEVHRDPTLHHHGRDAGRHRSGVRAPDRRGRPQRRPHVRPRRRPHRPRVLRRGGGPPPGLPRPALPAGLPGHASLRPQSTTPGCLYQLQVSLQTRPQRRHRGGVLRRGHLRRRCADFDHQDRRPRQSARGAWGPCSSSASRPPTGTSRARWWPSCAAQASSTKP